MTGLAMTGWGVLCPHDCGPGAIPAPLADGASSVEPSDLYEDVSPTHRTNAIVDFNVRKLLGRKGTSFLDRSTGLTLVACGRALEDSQYRVTDENRNRIGVVLGTTCGSLKSMIDYTIETLVEDRPYLVNAALFPNTVMNCAAGQAAIWYGLKGVNATLAGEQLAFLSTLRYAVNTLRCGYADALLVGAVEEFTPHRAWATEVTSSSEATIGVGEAAAVFVVEPSKFCRNTERRICGEVLSVTIGRSRSGQVSQVLADNIGRALGNAGVTPAELSYVATGETGDSIQDDNESQAIHAALDGADVERILVKPRLGECHAASGALQLAAILELHRDAPDRDGQLALLTNCTQDGGVGAAIVRGWSRVGTDPQ